MNAVENRRFEMQAESNDERLIKYAFGFEDEMTRDGVRCFGHGGGSPGMNGRLSVFPSSNYVVVALANIDPPAADDMAGFIVRQKPNPYHCYWCADEPNAALSSFRLCLKETVEVLCPSGMSQFA